MLLFNHSADTTRRFNVLIGTEKAEQWQKSYYLAPLETKAISINEIVEKQMADEKGRTLPKDAVAGQVTWFTRSPKWGKGRLMVSQPQQGMARSFSCGTCADVCPDGYFSPFSFQDIVPTGSGPIGYMVVSECTHACSINSCTGPKIGQTTDVTYRWSSSNSSIATVSGGLHSSSGSVVGVGPGSTTANATAQGDFCQAQAQAPIKVQVPTSLKVLSVAVLPNGSGPPNGCPASANYGIKVDTKYQVLDQTGNPIMSATMTPHETGTFFTGGTYDGNIGPVAGYPTSSATTGSDGSFHDVPFGGCATGAFTSFTATQNITIIMPNGSSPAVRSQTFTLTGTTAGHGTLKNNVTSPSSGSDISATR